MRLNDSGNHKSRTFACQRRTRNFHDQSEHFFLTGLEWQFRIFAATAVSLNDKWIQVQLMMELAAPRYNMDGKDVPDFVDCTVWFLGSFTFERSLFIFIKSFWLIILLCCVWWDIPDFVLNFYFALSKLLAFVNCLSLPISISRLMSIRWRLIVTLMFFNCFILVHMGFW